MPANPQTVQQSWEIDRFLYKFRLVTPLRQNKPLGMYHRMNSPYRRRKDPTSVRSQLLECTIKMAQQKGLGAITIESVARDAGVTKGGLFHHFPNKLALVDAALDRLTEHFIEMLESRMALDPAPYGRFTRAYLQISFDLECNDSGWTVLWLSIMSDPNLRSLWAAKLRVVIAPYHKTDNDPELEIARLAADGIRMAQFAALTPCDLDVIQSRLFAMAAADKSPPTPCAQTST